MDTTSKLKIKKQDYLILKAYLQTQVLLDTLDDVENESKMDIKHSTKKYKQSLENKVNEVIKNTFNSNRELFSMILMDLNSGIDSIEKYFEIN
jgi:hypothetical protein